MTRDEINATTNEKVEQIKSLCSILKIQLTAEQAITEGGLIRNVVYFLDTEKYDLDEEKSPVATPVEAVPVEPTPNA